jgi:Fe2+ transport system protein B
VANYAGVYGRRREDPPDHTPAWQLRVLDLPGTYSLPALADGQDHMETCQHSRAKGEKE